MIRAAVVLAALAASVPAARAEVVRFAVIAGNDTGLPSETPLRYAERDADKVHDVLRRLGGFPAENTILLRGADAAATRRALIDVNDRIRRRAARGDQTILFVYYSGHADDRALHMAGSALELDELEQLVSGSAATMRVLVLDACRSGAITTRGKGGAQGAPIDLRVDERLASEGVIMLSSSAADEDAQESDELRGSFFTHYLVSGLLGAADADGDGRVDLDEAYAYAYDHTVRASSRTASGAQHPSFGFDTRGRRGFALTFVHARAADRAVVEFPPGRGYLLLRDGPDGAVVGEIGRHDRVRALTVAPGRYFVRARADRHLLEGSIAVRAGERRRVADRELDRIEYARLVRKGAGVLDRVHGVRAGYRARGPLADGFDACHGAFAQYALELRALTLAPRISACRAAFANDSLSGTRDELDLELRVARAWDGRRATLELGVGAGAALLHQQFTTDGLAPARTTVAGHVGAAAGVIVDGPRGTYAAADAGVTAYAFREQPPDMTTPTWVARLTLGVSVGLGLRW